MADSVQGLRFANRMLQSLVVSGLLCAVPSWAAVVTTVADSGPGSLRQAITDANNDGVPTVITFDPLVFPTATPAVIALGPTALPNLTGAGDTIDGTGAGVVIDGTGLTPIAAAGLRVRASNITINGLTFRNFAANDAIVVEGRDSRPVVTGVMITGNRINNSFRAIRVDGGTETIDTTISASVVGNILTDNIRGILAAGNVGAGNGGNTVTVFIDSNTIKGAGIPPPDPNNPGAAGGDGITLRGATGSGSGNRLLGTVSNNTLNDVPDDGILAIGCGGGGTGSFNRIDAVITANVVRYKNDASPAFFTNSGIVINGAAGESGDLSLCTDNTILFEVSNNTVDGFKNSNIAISGGDEGTARHNVSGLIVGNTATNSRGNPGGTSLGGTGISISAGQGTNHRVHDILISGNKVSGNPRRGIVITGSSSLNSALTNIEVSSNSIDGKPPQSPQYAIVPFADQDGILVTGSTTATGAQLTQILIDANNVKNHQRAGLRVSQGDTNLVALTGITDNLITNNAEDGINIIAGVTGATGGVPISGNQCNSNGQDGIDLNSPGYALSNNSCNRNVGDGINAVVGNTNDGGNTGRRNGACNQPAFCFNTPL